MTSAFHTLRHWLQANFGWDIYEWEPDDIRSLDPAEVVKGKP